MKTKKTTVMAITVPKDLAEFFENLRWDLRKDKGVMLREILTNFAEKHGYVKTQG